jgi:trans-aconitate methyltransferase
MRRIIQRFVDRILDLCDEIHPNRVVDLGCGEGIVAQDLLARHPEIEYLGIDLNPEAVDVARAMNPSAEFAVGSIFDEPQRPGWADLVICLEVLEHLEDPDPAVVQAMKWTRQKALFSVPWEPWFRMGNFLRGKYLTRLGNHPEHRHQFNPDRFQKLLIPRVSSVAVTTCFPWVIAEVAR